MTIVIVGMLLALLLALGVVALVAVPARREGREVLTPHGEQLVQQARDRVVDLRDRLPTPGRDAGERVGADTDQRAPGLPAAQGEPTAPAERQQTTRHG